VKIGSGCHVWVGTVEKLSKSWNPGFKTKATLLAGWRLRRVARAGKGVTICEVNPRKASGFLPDQVLCFAIEP
jgi:hypothetical protein